MKEFLKTPPWEREAVSCGHVPDAGGAEYRINNQQVCEDCYFSALSDAIDTHPIGRVIPHGGCH